MTGESNIDYHLNSDDENRNRFFELTNNATIALNRGEDMVAIDLFLAAYECALKCSDSIIEIAIKGVKKAWDIAFRLKNRPIAEYIFEVLAKHLDEQNLENYSNQLHDLMLDKLKGLGVPVEHLQDTSSANDALKKMKDFINDVSNEIKQDGDSTKNQNRNDVNKQDNKQGDSSYYVRRDIVKYDNLVGYESAISTMKKMGIAGQENSEYMQLVQRLNKEHGLNRISFSKTLIFKSPCNVDANIFMEATATEIGLPCMHMHMDDNIQGASVLCMMAPADGGFRLNPGRTGFDGKGILMLEDIDTWDLPDIADVNDDSINPFISAQMSRGIAEVTNLLDIALQDPNILVMATVSSNFKDSDIMKFLGSDNFYVVSINNPNDKERASIWNKLAQDHPSLRAFSIQKLVNYSKNMSRYDIEIAVHEALEDAYRLGIKKGKYIPLSIANIIEKLADHQPLDSVEYKTLEDLATADFKKELDNIDDILK